MRHIISDTPIAYEAGQDPIRVTMSIGGAISESSDTSTDVETLVARADEALYRAKADGRNKVEICLTAA